VDGEVEKIVMTILADIREDVRRIREELVRTMGKKRKKITPEQAAFNERTKMIRDYLARLDERIAARKAAEAQQG